LDNFDRVRGEINEGVTLVCVTKNRSVSDINTLIDFGVKDIGENRVSEALRKFVDFGRPVKKHFIGTIQSNKVRNIVLNFDLIQSVYRLKIVRLIDKFAGEMGKIMPILVQVNISCEDSKGGVFINEVEGFLEKVVCFENVRVIGLMSIGSVGCKYEFRRMKKLFDDLKQKGFFMKILSMGTSKDFEMAIKEGANMVRVGSKIFV
jgi:pyridoxal phosphate enzyme (YggS family)